VCVQGDECTSAASYSVWTLRALSSNQSEGRNNSRPISLKLLQCHVLTVLRVIPYIREYVKSFF